jgi:cytochrome c oxidase cbb3-type subunit 4
MIMFHSIWTVLLVMVFIGIVAWAWHGNRKQAFDEAARLPLDDDPVTVNGDETND